MAQARAVHRFTVDEYYAMARAGILGEDARVELVDGEVVHMPPIGARHASSVKRLNRLIERAVGDRAVIGVQDPVRLDQHTELLPDVSVLRPRADVYADAHPAPEDVLLLIEVADTTATYDREVKVPLYARAGVPEVWLVDLEAGAIEVFRAPEADAYREHSSHGRGDSVTAGALPALELRVDDVLA